MNILVTGGAGYIGSHTIVELFRAGHNCISLDNFSNSSPVALDRVSEIVGSDVTNYKNSMDNVDELKKILESEKIEAVIHFAGLKAVGESVKSPLLYYDNNLSIIINLLKAMRKSGIHRLIFSSSATVYGTSNEVPLTEDMPANYATNPYGWTKVMAEQIIKDYCKTDEEFSATLLRYFNPIGAHSSGLIGEDPNGVPNNLLPYVAQVASGKLAKLHVFGNDWNTPDGTGVRDYIHVTDLATGHLSALGNQKIGASIYNLGTGKGVSVLEVIKTFDKVSQQKIPYEIVARREVDVAESFADASLAKNELGWQSTKSLEDACQDTWNWQTKNPNGY